MLNILKSAAMALAALMALEVPVMAQPDETETPGATPIALVEEAYVAHRKGDYDAAVKGYTKIIQRRGLTRRERAISYLLRGEARRDAGQLEEALLDFTRSLKQWPGYPQAHYFRGRVYEQLGKYVEAYADIAKALELDPEREAYETSLTLLKIRMQEAGTPIPAGAALEPSSPELPGGE